MSMPGASELDKIASDAWKKHQEGDNRAIDNVYHYLLPFCLRVCSKTCGRYITNADEEASIASLAIIEAFEKYNPARGSFLVYLGQVVRNRIIDFIRREKKQKTISFSFFTKQENIPEIIDDNLVENIIDDLARKQEIEEFKEMLGTFNISLNDLISSCPRQQTSREKAKQIAWVIIKDKELSNFLIEKKRLPIKNLEAKYSMNRKFLDRYRKFIIANVLILVSNFSYLKSYVLPDSRGDINER